MRYYAAILSCFCAFSQVPIAPQQSPDSPAFCRAHKKEADARQIGINARRT